MLATAAIAQDIETPIRPLNAGDWIITADYPASSIAAGEEGTVAFKLGVAADGSVTSCEILGGTAPQRLKELTCKVVTQRARFVPGRSASGEPLTGSYTATVRWQIPQTRGVPRPTPEEEAWTHVIVIETDGSVSSCTIESKQTGVSCDYPDGPMFEPFLDEDGKPVRKRVRTQTIITIEDPDS
tara:strand:+ start:574 stop:1125 length:552 start_codon:yes stop_codon:yes gene_type:complete